MGLFKYTLEKLRWGSLNINEQCHKCRGRIKLRPCAICFKLFCLGHYEQRWSKYGAWDNDRQGYVVCVCQSCLPKFVENTGKGKPVSKEFFKKFGQKNFC